MGDWQTGYNDGIRGLYRTNGSHAGFLAGQAAYQQQQQQIWNDFGPESGRVSDPAAAVRFLTFLGVMAYCLGLGGLAVYGYQWLYDWAWVHFSKEIIDSADYSGLVPHISSHFETPPWLEKYSYEREEVVQAVFWPVAILNFVLVLVSSRYRVFAVRMVVLAILLGLVAFALLFVYLWMAGEPPRWMS